MLFTQLFINGLQTGALYALIAAGFSLIFGMTRIFHAAHGATFTIAGYIFYSMFADKKGTPKDVHDGSI